MCTWKAVLAALSGKCGMAFGGCGNRLSENWKRGCQRAEKGMYRSNSLQSDPACGNDGAVLQAGMVGQHRLSVFDNSLYLAAVRTVFPMHI